MQGAAWLVCVKERKWNSSNRRATIPIIGCPTLVELRISLDCQERVLSDEQGTSLDVLLSLLQKLSRLADLHGSVRRKGDLTACFTSGSARARLEQL